MTTPTHTRARPRRNCPTCGLPTANRGAHARACLGATDQAGKDLVVRAGAAAATPSLLAEEARFKEDIRDVDMARLLGALDSGARITLTRTLDWQMEGLSPFHGRLNRLAREAVRTGLAAVTRDGRLRAEPVHARSSAHPAQPACGAPGQLRYRLLGGEYIRLVDCEACLDTPLSGVAYSTDE